jgi:uncharacterized protein (TIGR03083 family)
MPDDSELDDIVPYDLMAAEADRIAQHYQSLSDEELQQPSRCAGWSRRDLLAHMASTEEYNQACLDGTVQQFMTQMGEKGATDLATANEIGVRSFDGEATQAILEIWQTRCRDHTEALRARDGGEIDTTVGGYPARWQAFHLAFELATHADDAGVPVTAEEAAARTEWLARFGRFALKEAKPELTIEARDGHTHVRGDNVDIDLTDERFVQAVMARLPADSGIDAATAAVLSVTP